MSRWAERFAALSRSPDTIDTRDTRSVAGDARPFVGFCQTVHDTRLVVPTAPKSAEIQASLKDDRPFVKSVASVKGGDTRSGGRPLSDPIPARTVATPPDTRSDDPEERAAIVAEGAGAPRAWSEGYAALAAMPPPSGFSPERWERIIDATGAFLDRWAGEAIRCGWTDLNVFGAHPGAPAARFDAMGLVLLLDRVEVVAIDRDGADLVTVTGAIQRFRRRKLPQGTVLLWELTPRAVLGTSDRP